MYLRVTELLRRIVEKSLTQKNWIPFSSFNDKKARGYDEFIYFIYEWSNLKILKCNLSKIIGSVSYCDFDYQLDIGSTREVGPLRGGTLLVNVNELLNIHFDKFPKMRNVISKLPQTREIWIGFARAHLSDCGCIKHF